MPTSIFTSTDSSRYKQHGFSSSSLGAKINADRRRIGKYDLLYYGLRKRVCKIVIFHFFIVKMHKSQSCLSV